MWVTPVHVLLDSSADDSFVDDAPVEQAHIPVVALDLLRLLML